MKSLHTILAMALVAPAMAGTSAKEVVAPAPPSCLATWFAGGSVGYLTEFEEPMYTLHIGQDTCHQFGGWDFAWFLEVGYTNKDESFPPGDNESEGSFDEDGSFDLDELEDALKSIAIDNGTGYEIDIIPITINGKLERPLGDNLSCYVGAGLGMSNVDLEISVGNSSFSDDDWVFTAQAFAGLIYNFSPSCELYGGARWIYFDDADFGNGTLELDDDILIEVGGRCSF